MNEPTDMTVSEQRTHSGSFIPLVLLVIVGAGIGLVSVEVGLRVYQRWRHGIPVTSNQPRGALREDATLGWAPRESYRNAHGELTQTGSQYVVRFSQNSSGMRVCDAPEGRKTMLFVGDSYTEAWEASDGREYYCVAASTLGVGAQAFGAGGYGTLQERMVLDRLLATMRPDLIVVQICFNDFINNDYDLEKASWQNNHFSMRPYWRSGRIEFLIPTHYNLWFEAGRRHSRVMSDLYNGFVNRSAATAHSVEQDIETGQSQRGFEVAVAETREIFGQISKLSQGTKLIGMPVDLKEPYLDAFRQIFRELNIPLVEDAAIAVSNARAMGTDVFAGDGVHWNEAGHRIAGEALAQAVEKNSEFALGRAPAVSGREK
jgi:lysophospholipase L1-like esterase